jgi:hypothetical protein
VSDQQSVDSRDIAVILPDQSRIDYFGQTVSIYQLGIYGLASADVLRPIRLTEDHLNRSYSRLKRATAT